MKCPNDDTILQITERQGIEIDYCPSCRGVWLDRGELDKIIDRADNVAPPSSKDTRGDRWSGGRGYDDDDRSDRRTEGSGQKRKRGGFLGELFEFGG